MQRRSTPKLAPTPLGVLVKAERPGTVGGMRVLRILLAVAVAISPTLALAADAGAPRLSDDDLCVRSRTLRVESVQLVTRRWLARIDAMKAACSVAWVKTGAVKVADGRVSPEQRGDVKCPKGPPPGETKESVWSVLSLFLAEPVFTDERISIGDETLDGANERCEALDTSQGVVLRPLVNDLPALRRIVAWKAPRGDAGAPK